MDKTKTRYFAGFLDDFLAGFATCGLGGALSIRRSTSSSFGSDSGFLLMGHSYG